MSSSSSISACRHRLVSLLVAGEHFIVLPFDPLIYASLVSPMAWSPIEFFCVPAAAALLLLRASSIILQDRSTSFQSYILRHANLPVPQPERAAMAVDQPLSRRHWSASSSPFYRSAASSCRRTWSRAADHVVVARLRPSSPSNAAPVANRHEELTIGH
jgi:hypothetical protein